MIGRIFLGLLATIFLEIYVGIEAIRAFGFGNVFFAGLATFVLGVGLFRTSSLRLTVGVAQAMREGKPPGTAALDGALIGLAGIFFLIPGFISDVLGFLLLIPPIRKWGANRLVGVITVRQAGAAGPTWQTGPTGRSSRTSAGDVYENASDAVIDVDAVVIDDTKSRHDTKS